MKNKIVIEYSTFDAEQAASIAENNSQSELMHVLNLIGAAAIRNQDSVEYFKEGLISPSTEQELTRRSFTVKETSEGCYVISW